jgi:peptide/nickel transport system permease protein
VTKRDFPVIQGLVLIIAVAVVVMNLLADVLYAYLDPRIRY